MRFFNPDGRTAEMCGNGARCAARLACDLGITGASMTIATDAGAVHARVEDDTVRLSLPDPTDIEPCFDLEVGGHTISLGSANTGVPHVMLEVQEMEEAPVMSLGPSLRYHTRFAPAGTNVNFVRRIDDSHLEIRTYERGVEAETGACGTGATAAAVIMALRGRAVPPVTVTTVSGDRLRIAFDAGVNAVSNLTMSGPAVYVFKGSVALPVA
jgi:diaminopimelate epimerase